MIRFWIRMCLILATLPVAQSVSAQWYQVELIVFEHVNPGFDGEDWFRDPGLAPLNSTVRPVYYVNQPPAPVPVEADAPVQTETLIPYRILPTSRHRLQGVYQALRQSRDYRPAYHIAWLQPGQDGNRSRALHLQQEDSGSLYELTLPPALVTDPMPTEFYEPVKLLIDGTVRIRSAALLYVDLDMVLFRSPASDSLPAPVIPTDEQLTLPALPEKPAEYVRLTESRRIRLNDLQYFDHPRFGVILQVGRYEPETATGTVPAATPEAVPGT
jgi:hypothetical protein